MSLLQIGCLFLLSVSITKVHTWTIDLPEARKFFFEQADKQEHYEKEFQELKEKKEFVDNIHPDSPHNRDELRPDHHEDDSHNDVYNSGQYAEDYEYLSYMEKKVHGIVHNGSVYLEGLRVALEDYGELLKNCRRLNLTQPQSPNGPWLSENDPRQTSNSNSQTGSFSNQPGSSNNQPGPFNGTQFFKQTGQLDYETCNRATRSSEHVRRLAELALWATRELQDKAYNDKYNKNEGHDSEEEEAELLVRLAFFLDRLAFFTGYEPQPGQFLTEKPDRPSTTTPTPNSVMGEVPEDVMSMMMNCLKSNSSEPATERCKYPLQYPDFIKQMFNVTDQPSLVEPVSSTEPYQPKDPSFMETFKNPSTRRQKREITSDEAQDRGEKGSEKPRDKRGFLVQAIFGPKLAQKILEGIHEDLEHEHFEDVHHRRRLLEKLKVLKNSHKKLMEFIAAIRHRHEIEKEHHEHEIHHEHEFHHHEHPFQGFKDKRNVQHSRQPRSVENPLLEVMKYVAKHKVWANSNQHNPGDLDVANQVTEVRLLPDEYQASTDKHEFIKIQKRSIDNKKHEHLKLPEDPSQDLSNYVKRRRGVNYITDENETQKLRQYLDKIQHSKSATAKEYAQKLLKRRTRAITYGNKYKPSEAEDPKQDISYYVKNKEGTEYQMNLVQAAQVRSNLEGIFQNPNIEVVRRYGFNRNPLIPYPLGYGIAQTFFGDI